MLSLLILQFSGVACTGDGLNMPRWHTRKNTTCRSLQQSYFVTLNPHTGHFSHSINLPGPPADIVTMLPGTPEKSGTPHVHVCCIAFPGCKGILHFWHFILCILVISSYYEPSSKLLPRPCDRRLLTSHASPALQRSRAKILCHRALFPSVHLQLSDIFMITPFIMAATSPGNRHF